MKIDEVIKLNMDNGIDIKVGALILLEDKRKGTVIKFNKFILEVRTTNSIDVYYR